MMFGGIEQERIVLNEQTLWSGSHHDPDRPDAAAALPAIRELLFAGRFVEAQQRMNEHFTCRPGSSAPQGKDTPFGCYQTLGNLILDFAPPPATPPPPPAPHAAPVISGYRRELDLRTGVAGVSYQTGTTRHRPRHHHPQRPRHHPLHHGRHQHVRTGPRRTDTTTTR
jgi:alpha-L-fucosidase 2